MEDVSFNFPYPRPANTQDSLFPGKLFEPLLLVFENSKHDHQYPLYVQPYEYAEDTYSSLGSPRLVGR